MAGALGGLVVTLSADIARFTADMGKAARIAEQHAQAMDKLAGKINGLLAGVSTAGLSIYIKGLIDAADKLDKLSERTGIGVGALSELAYAAQGGGVDVQALGKAIQTFNLQLVAASDAGSKQSRMFRELGVDIKAGPNEALKQFAERASTIEDVSVKVATFRAAFGKTGDELIPVFANLKETTEQARRLGITMSEETAKSAAKLNDALTTLSERSKALTVKAMTPAVEGLATFTGELVKAAEKGEYYLAILREIEKVLGATMAVTAKEFGPKFLGDFVERQTDAFFNPPKQMVKGKIGGLAPPEPPKPPPSSDSLRRILAEDPNKALALQKREYAAMQQMEEKQRSLNGLTEEQITTWRLSENVLTDINGKQIKILGTEHDFSKAVKDTLLAQARSIDLRKQTIERIEVQYGAMRELNKVGEEAYNVQSEFVTGLLAANREFEFQASLIGKTAYEQQQLTALRAIDLAARKASEQLDPETQMAAIEGIQKQATLFKEKLLPMMEQRRQAERDWSTGAKAALTDYIETVGSAANSSAMLFSNAFRNMEDALVEFTRTGKLDFRSLADSIISDLIRIQVRQNITTPLASLMGAGGLTAAIGGYLGFGAKNAAASTGPGSANSFDSGAMASALGLPRFAEGIDYVPYDMVAQIHEGERVMTKAENAGGGRGDTYFIDARGADRTGMARLEAAIRAVNASVERRSIQAWKGYLGNRGMASP